MYQLHKTSCEIGGKTLTLETGKLAKQANASVMASFGDTRVLATVCASKEPKDGIDFFPLTVEYAERFYAAGKIPGGFFRREGKPTQDATLSARMIDRPIRPLFPEGFYNEVQVVASILSYDPDSDPDIAAAAAVSAALTISDLPFNGPTGACRIGRINGQFVVNPTWAQVQSAENEMEVLVAGTAKGITMVEGGARQVTEEVALEGILLGHRELAKVAAAAEALRMLCGKPKRAFTPPTHDTSLKSEIEKIAKGPLMEALKTKEKASRYDKMDAAHKLVLEKLVPQSLRDSDEDAAEAKEKQVNTLFELLKYNLMREMILNGSRIDGRDTKTVRPIWVETNVLPRVHGSSIFTRGETQVMAAITLGTSQDEQIIDSLAENTMRKFMLHYNFPPYSVGETGRMGGQSRREIGHGALAERSIKACMPKFDDFPYTVRIVCETLESNGSSSMGSVCSASMALMDAGVPYLKPVAGIAMGLIKEADRVAVLSDILGDEDHLGDMDFKVAGTSDGITGIQMDIKIEGVDEAIMKKALAQAREGRLHILSEMAKGITAPKVEMSKFAPRITTLMIPVDKIREVIGTGGKVIKEIIASTGCKIDITDDGKVNVASNDGVAAQKAIDMIQNIIAEVEVGKIYKGTVKKIVDFGAFVGVLPSQDGLLHISEIAHERVENVLDYMKEGDVVEVKVIDVDRMGKVKLSRKVLLPPPPGGGGHSSGGGGGYDRDRGGRDDRGGGRGGPPRGGGYDRDRGGRDDRGGGRGGPRN